MAFDLEARRGEIGQIARAGLDIEDPRALPALEVVVVPMCGQLIARALAGQINGLDDLFLDQGLQGPIDRGDPETGDFLMGSREDLLR